MKNNNATRKEAEKFFKKHGLTNWGDSSYYGYTYTPAESPSGNLRVIVTDQTGEAAKVSDREAVESTGHELYGHALLYSQGKEHRHGRGYVPDSVFKAIEHILLL